MTKVFLMGQNIIALLNRFSYIIDLLLRLWVANVFWKSGLVKIANMDATVWLFTNEYHVPLLSPTFAAYSSTYVELIFSVLLAIGLASRFSALMLFGTNLVAALSYASLQDVAVQWHVAWGLALLVIIFHGPGKIAVDGLVEKWVKLAASKKI